METNWLHSPKPVHLSNPAWYLRTCLAKHLLLLRGTSQPVGKCCRPHQPVPYHTHGPKYPCSHQRGIGVKPPTKERRGHGAGVRGSSRRPLGSSQRGGGGRRRPRGMWPSRPAEIGCGFRLSYSARSTSLQPANPNETTCSLPFPPQRNHTYRI